MALEFANIFVETSLVGNVRAGELQDPFPAEGMFEGFFTDGALAAHKGSLATIPGAFNIHNAGHATGIRSTNGETATRAF